LASGTTRHLLLDANVLIDYVQSGRSILELTHRHLGPVHVVSVILDEVDSLDAAACKSLGIEIVEPDLAQVVAAGARRGPLSFQDHLCLALAKERGWSCV